MWVREDKTATSSNSETTELLQITDNCMCQLLQGEVETGEVLPVLSMVTKMVITCVLRGVVVFWSNSMNQNVLKK